MKKDKLLTDEEKHKIASKIAEFAFKLGCYVDIREDEMRIYLPQYNYES